MSLFRSSIRTELTGVLLLLAVLACTPLLGSDYWTAVGFSLLMWIALSSAWALFSTLTGYISLGHVVFVGMGTYTAVLLWGQLPVWMLLPISGLVAALLALVIGAPVLRVRGPYFVILTLGIAELVKSVVTVVEAGLGHASRVVLGAPSVEVLFYWMLACCVLAVMAGWYVRAHPRWWLGLRSLRDNEEAAETVGIPVTRLKMWTLVVSGFITGAVGGVLALRATYFAPGDSFSPMVSFTMIAMCIVGGGDSLKGPILGAIALTVLQEALWANFPQLYTILLGALLASFVLFVPGGLSGYIRRMTIAWLRRMPTRRGGRMERAGSHK